MNLFYLWVISKTLLCGCSPDSKRYDFDKVRSKYTIDKIAFLPSEISESSGLASASDGVTFWTHNDSGSPAELFRVGLDGKVLETRKFPTLTNRDWEELAQDKEGRVFIGDIGNNSNGRRDLAIYILPPGWEEKSTVEEIGRIKLTYGQQKDFPEKKELRNFDSEGFFFHNDSLFLFSKNTGKRPRYTMLYKIPARAGDYTLYPSDSIRLNETITGADISPDGRQFVLLSYGKVFFFDIQNNSIGFTEPAFCFKKYRGQTEAILYKNSSTLLITNEKGALFELQRK